MSSSAQAQQQQQASNSNLSSPSSSSSSSSAASSNASSLIKLDELSSFGATKQNRLPALIKLNPLADQTNSMQQQQQQQQQQQLTQEQQQQQQQAAEAANSMPNFSESQLDKMATVVGQQQQQQQHADSLPANLQQRQGQLQANKENSGAQEAARPMDDSQRADESSDDFQVVEMDEGADHDQGATLMGPSLPAANEAPAAPDSLAPKSTETTIEVNKRQHLSSDALQNLDAKSLSAQLQSTNLSNPYASHLGDSLIEMIINLRNENQNLVRALETNNEYVKERLSEFKKCQEDSKKREAAYAMEKAEHEHQIRKLQRQNSVLSERLKSMEAKLKDMKLEVSESLNAANSSKTSSLRNGDDNNLYPQLGATADESFSNSALLDASASANANANNQAITMQMDATSGELYNNHNNIGSNEDDQDDSDSDDSVDDDDDDDDDHDDDDLNDVNEQRIGATVGRAMDTTMDEAASSQAGLAQRVGGMSKEELSKRFDANKTQFYSLDDPMKQCDQLEQQLNDIGKRDYEICLLQQQLNIYRQDFRLERMAKLEARIQIEKLKNDIDRLCLERVQEQDREQERIRGGRGKRGAKGSHPNASPSSAHVRFGTTSNDSGSSAFIGKLGHHLGRKAAKSAAKAAKYAAKRAHLEEKAAAAMARAASAKAAASSHFSYSQSNQTAEKQQHMATDQQQQQQQQPGAEYHHHRGHHRGHQRHHSHHQRAPRTGIRSEVVNDLLSTANKAMLTGYKMASTHVNLALDKLNQYEQQQANNLDPNNRTTIQQTKAASATGSINPSAPPMEPPSID